MRDLPMPTRSRNVASYSRREGWVYVVRAGDAVKIGFTSGCPHKRVRDLQTGSAVRLRLIGLKRTTKAEEREFHQMLDGYRMHGEWFDVNGLPVGVLVDRLERDPVAAGVAR